MNHGFGYLQHEHGKQARMWQIRPMPNIKALCSLKAML